MQMFLFNPAQLYNTANCPSPSPYGYFLVRESLLVCACCFCICALKLRVKNAGFVSETIWRAWMRMATLQPPSPQPPAIGHPIVLCVGTEAPATPVSCSIITYWDPKSMEGKLGFPSGFGVILDLWIHKTVLEHFSPYLMPFQRLLSEGVPLGSFTNTPA